MPTVGQRARGHDPKKEGSCPRKFCSRGGNAKAFYAQRNACKLHLEHCPTTAQGAQELIATL